MAELAGLIPDMPHPLPHAEHASVRRREGVHRDIQLRDCRSRSEIANGLLHPLLGELEVSGSGLIYAFHSTLKLVFPVANARLILNHTLRPPRPPRRGSAPHVD